MSKYHRSLNKRKWAKVRLAILERDSYRCQLCGKAGAMEVDHIESMEKYPQQDPYNMAGLQALCRNCHWDKTTIERGPVNLELEVWRAFMVDEFTD